MGGAKRAIKKAVGGVRKGISKVPGGNIVNTAVDIGSLGTYRVAAGKGGLLGRDAKALMGGKVTPNFSGGSVPISALEEMYGVSRPGFESVRGPDGQLRSEFAFDPSKSAAFSKLREQAMAAPGESPWAKMQLEKQALEQSGLRDQSAQAAAQAVAQQQSSLARMGGLGGGARERIAASGAKNLARSQQDVARQGMLSRLGITEQDIGRQQNALGAVGTEELKGQAANLQSMTGDVKDKALFDMERYKEQMRVIGANKTADAQVAAANAGRKK